MTKKLVLLSVATILAMHARSPLVNVRKRIPSLCIEMRYATPHNITGKPMRSSHGCYLCQAPARALRAVQQELESMDYCLKVWDAYQPYSEQREVCRLMEEMNIVEDTRSTAPSGQGDAHCRGYAVDVTLVRECMEVDMGTDFDDVSPKARRSPEPDEAMEVSVDADAVIEEEPVDPNYVSPEALEHRELLRSVMEKHGFRADPDSWWHFDYEGWERKPVLDIPFSELN